MLTEKQLDRYADVLLWGIKTARTGKIRKNDIFVIRYEMPAIRLAEILYTKLLHMGIHPIQRMNPTPVMEKSFYSLSKTQQLVFIAPGEEELAEKLNGSISIFAPQSMTHLRDTDPRKIGKVAVAKKYLRDILEKRESQGNFSWTLGYFPTAELARHAGCSLKDYTRQVINACFLDNKSPISEWQHIFKSAQSIKKWLNSLPVEFFHIESENIDLEVTPGERRKWIGISGRNIPSFEIFTSPDWRGTRGIYFADQPSYRSGNYVEHVQLEFQKGQVVNVAAKTGEDFARKQLKMDRGASKLGEFSLTDKRFSKINRFMANTLYDENYGGKHGNCHVALGASYSNTFVGDPRKLSQTLKNKLGFNESALHWDLVNTEKKRVTAHLKSGKVVTIYENGQFAY